MRRYAAFLRAVSPMNASMAELRKTFEEAGFVDVITRLSSGNVIFSTNSRSEAAIARKAEAAMMQRLQHSFLTIVRPVDDLRTMLARDPYRKFPLPPQSKRIVTFLRDKPSKKLKLPIEREGSIILGTSESGREIFSAYVPTPKGPVFMVLIEKTFGKELTTRTWETVAKVAR